MKDQIDQITRELKGSKNILLYAQMPPPFHGSNIMTLTLFKALTKLGYRVKVSDKGFSKNIDEVNKISIVKLFRLMSMLWRFNYDLLSFRPDMIVFFISSTKIGLLAEGLFVAFAHILRIPYVLYIHNNGHKALYWQGRFGRWIVKRVFDRAKACLVLGKLFQKDIGSFYKNKVYILPNALMTTWRKKEKKSERHINVLYLSNLSEAKGISTLIQAIPKVLAQHRNVKFFIAGPWQDDDVKNSIFNMVRNKELSAFVEFLGPKYGREKEELFLKSDIFVFPSHYHFESFGLVNLEAMQAGLPVITTNLGAMPEIVKDGRTGFIIPPKKPQILAEKINVLVKDQHLRRTMGREGQKRFNALYSFDAYSSNVQGIMNDLL